MLIELSLEDSAKGEPCPWCLVLQEKGSWPELPYLAAGYLCETNLNQCALLIFAPSQNLIELILIACFFDCILYPCILGPWIHRSSRQGRLLQRFLRLPRSAIRDSRRKAGRCQWTFLPPVWGCWSYYNTERTGWLEGMDQESHP